jgi:hypothetical protein
MARDIAVMRQVFAGADPTATAAGYVEQVINSHALEGWEFVGVGEMSVTERPGCLGSLLGYKETLTVYNILIFRRAKQ